MTRPEQIRRELVQQWWKRATEDIALAGHLVGEKSAFFGAATFHAQQGAEKAIKAFLVRCQVEFPKTHDLQELLDLTATVDPELAFALRDAANLTPYGVQTRYPGDWPEVTREEAGKAALTASKVMSRLAPQLQDDLA